MSKISIKGTVYVVKYSLRGLFLFEKITGYAYAHGKEERSLFDVYVLFYAFLLAANEEMSLTLPEFIDACDDDPRLMVAFNEEMARRNARDQAILVGMEGEGVKKKKARRKP